MVSLSAIDETEIGDFRRMAEDYWREVMPHASVLRNAKRRQSYFHERFLKNTSGIELRWATVSDRRVGFITFSISSTQTSATIEDLYVLPNERRRGTGSAIIRELLRYLDQHGVELIELNVRRDNPGALAFWEEQGFRIALYHLRQYRDPNTGTAYIGTLSSDFIGQTGK